MTETELLPCPLCDGSPTKSSEGGSDERNGYAITETIRCRDCGLSISRSGDSSKGGYADNSHVDKDVVAAWNTRPSIPASVSEAAVTDAETLAEEFIRLVREYREGAGSPTSAEAWNLIADFAVENASALSAALASTAETPAETAEPVQDTWFTDLALPAKDSELVEAAKAVLNSWDERGSERERFVPAVETVMGQGYWSPAASLVSSEAIAALRAALRATEERDDG